MKKLFFITIMIIQTSILFAQNQNITKIWGNSLKDERTTTVFEVNNNTYFISLFREYGIGNTPAECILLKLDSCLNVTDSFKLNSYINNNLKYWLINFFNYNNQIFAQGYAFDSISLKAQIWLSKWDVNLTLLYDTIINNKDSSAQLFNSHLLNTRNNNLLITTQYYPPLHDSTNTIVWLLDSVFNIINENEFHTKVGFESFSVVEVPVVQCFHIITQNEITKINSNNLNYNGIVWKADDEWSQWMSVGGALALNDSTYLQNRQYFFWDNNNKFGNYSYLYRRDKNGAIKDSILVGNQQQSYNKTSGFNFVFNTIDSIFVTGTNYSLDSSFNSNEENSIFLWNIMIDGNINWQKYYTIPNKKLLVNDISKTIEGGCLLTGKVWQWQSNQEINADIFFVKLDRYGNISGTQGINNILTQNEIWVYPNPVKDVINFDIGLHKEFRLMIYNSLGKLIINNKLTQGKNSIHIQNLKTGIYFYYLHNKTSKAITGKFIKE